MEGRLDIDAAESIAAFEAVINKFEIRKKLYQILFRGRGPEFDGFRVYSSDDDYSTIDWKASTRANKLLIKQYKEERHLKILFVVDVSDSMVFGSTKKLKCEYAGGIIAALADLMLDIGDKVGFLLYSEKVRNYIPPSSRRTHFEYLIDTLSHAKEYGGGSDMRKPLKFILETLGSNVDALIFISDFLQLPHDAHSLLGFVGNAYESLGIMVKDPIDTDLPAIDRELTVQDPQTGQRLLINPKVARAQYHHYAMEQEANIKKLFESSGVDLLHLKTDTPFAIPLAQFLESRVQKGVFL